jgi:Flp pilus assembly protein TadG
MDHPGLRDGAVRSLLDRLVRETKANVATIFALASVPLLFLTGMGIDYGLAADRQSQLNAFADAAALAAVTPTMMAESTSAATTAAQNTFNAQASTLAGVTYNANNLSVTISSNGSVRTVKVSYSAASQTIFPNILGMTSIALSGSSTATAGLAPNIDFYLLLDDSPSMAIGATSSDINTLVANTQSQCDSAPAGGSTCGCAFGCHETNPGNESHCNNWNCNQSGSGNPNGEDNYALARALGLTLRIDLLRTATANLMTTAQSTENKYNSSYRMAIYTFDVGFNAIQGLTSNLTTAQSSASNISLLEVYSNNYLTSSNYNDDTDTDYDNAFNNINTTMPNPGSGTNTQGDTPQEVLFIVTDGVEDEAVSSEPSMSSSYGNYSGSRQESTLNPLNASGSEIDTDWCTSIKNRGIRIAILYTEYLPIPNNGWYSAHVSSYQSNIGNQLEACASPGLYYEVTTDGNISSAMASLFQLAVQSAYLAK